MEDHEWTIDRQSLSSHLQVMDRIAVEDGRWIAASPIDCCLQPPIAIELIGPYAGTQPAPLLWVREVDGFGVQPDSLADDW